MNQRSTRDEERANALVTVQPPRLPFPAEAAEEGISPGQWRALVDAVFPSAKSVDGVLLAIRYANARKLDVFKRVVHVVPMWSSALQREVETVWPGIAEIRTTAQRTGQHAGNDDCVFGPTKTGKFKDRVTRKKRGRNGEETSYVDERESRQMEWPEWAQITVYKMVAGVRCAFVGPKVRFNETYSGIKGMDVPNERWQRAPFQMLEKCAEAAALRRAFPDELGEQWSAEEAEGKSFDGAGAIEGQYVVLDEEEQPAQGQGQPQREDTPAETEEEAEERRRYEWWGPSGLEEYMAYCEQGFSTLKSMRAVDKYLAEAKEQVDMLPKAAKARFDAIVEGARERLRKDPKAGGRKAAAAGAGQQQDEPDPADQVPPPEDDDRDDDDQAKFLSYLEQLERFASEAGTPVDVNSLRAREKTAIGQLPAEMQEEAALILDVAMDAAKGGGEFATLLAARRSPQD